MSIELSDIHYELLNPISPLYLIEELIEDFTTGAIIGESGSGKTFAAVSMACSVAAEVAFAGHKMNRPGSVIYFAGEGRNGVLRRVNAWKHHHNTILPPGRFFMPRLRVTFDDTGAEDISIAINKLAKEHGCPVLIVIDTLARAFPPGDDENSNKDMMAFLNRIETLKDQYNFVICIVHHTGHGTNQRARGASAFKGAMDWKFHVDGRKKIFKSTKMKEAEIPDPISFKLIEVCESAVMIFGQQFSEVSQSLSKADKFGLSTFHEAVDQLGKQEITLDEWRDVFYDMHKGKCADEKRKPFERARKNLIKKGTLIKIGENFALEGRTGQTGTMSRKVLKVNAGTDRDTPL